MAANKAYPVAMATFALLSCQCTAVDNVRQLKKANVV